MLWAICKREELLGFSCLSFEEDGADIRTTENF